MPDVVRRDGILCFFIGDEEDAVLKSEQSRRVLPIPQILLDLGFGEWVVAKRKFGETWLFPEIQPDKSHGRRSQIFGDRLRNLLKTLKLHDGRDDIYARRRTLSSKLMGLDIDTGTRQRILGHLEGKTIDRHYSDHELLELKDMLGSVDHGIEVGSDKRFGFPIIVGNRTALQRALDVEAALTDRREVSAVQLRDAETDEIVFEAAISGRKAPSAHPWNDCTALDEKEVASQIITLSRQYSLTMPASEGATAALEHLLILVDDNPFYIPAAKHSVADETEENGNAPAADAEPIVQDPDIRAVDLVAGDLVVCAFPSRRAGVTKSTARPGTVVNILVTPSVELRAQHGDRVAQILSDVRRALRVWSDEPTRWLVVNLRGRIPTLRDAQRAAGLTMSPDDAKRACSSLEGLASLEQSTTEDIAATEATVSAIFKRLSPEDLGCTTRKTFENKRSLCPRAVRLVDCSRKKVRKDDLANMSAASKRAFTAVEERLKEHETSALARALRFVLFADHFGADLENLDPGLPRSFYEADRSNFSNSHEEKLRRFVRAWNEAASASRLARELPAPALPVHRQASGAWGDVPECIRAPLDRILEKAVSARLECAWEDLVSESTDDEYAEFRMFETAEGDAGKDDAAIVIEPGYAEELARRCETCLARG